MQLTTLLSMATFALVASISPGPVNLVCLSCGTRFPLTRGLLFVTGATVGFIVLFVAVGLGLYSLFTVLPWLSEGLRWAGVLFLLYLAVQLWRDDGRLPDQQTDRAPSATFGAMMQWLNPKAWLASASGIAAYTSGDRIYEVMMFASVYLPICWLSLSCWVLAGAFMRKFIQRPSLLVNVNRVLAMLLIASCGYLLVG